MSWIDITEVLAHLNKTSGVDDGELDGFITAACSMIEDIKGHVDPLAVSDVVSGRWIPQAGVGHPYYVGPPYGGYSVYPGRRYLAELREVPVLSVASVARYDGGAPTVIPAEDLTTGTLGWLLRENVLYLPTQGEFTVTYMAGRDPIPGNYRMAALELVAHLWKTTQMNAKAPSPGTQADVDYQRGMTYALPFRVRELLGLYGTNIPNPGLVIA